MRLTIRRLDPTIPLPSYGTDEAAGFDLAAASDVDVPPRAVAPVRTGLIRDGPRSGPSGQRWLVGSRATRPVPTGHFLSIFARSSTPLKRGLIVASGVGIIDPDYSGPNDEIMIPVLNFTDATVHVRRGDRLAQG